MPPSWRDARRQWRGQSREALDHRRSGRVDRWGEQSLTERIRSFRRRAASSAVTIGMLATINLAISPEFWWFLFPAAGMMIGLMHRGAALWADGLRFKDIFGAEARRRLAEPDAGVRHQLAASPAQLAEKLAPRLSAAENALIESENRYQAMHDDTVLPQGVIHGDYFHDNVLWDEEGDPGRGIAELLSLLALATSAALTGGGIAITAISSQPSPQWSAPRVEASASGVKLRF